MIEFWAALAAFFAAHSLPRALGLRSRAVARLGRGPYVALYSVVSVALLVWLVSATLRAPVVPLWPPSAWAAGAAAIGMLPACLLAAAGAGRANPLSVTLAVGELDLARPGVLALTRHPILWAFLLWSLAHLLANGEAPAAVLFGVMALFSALGMPLMDRRARRAMGAEAWRRRRDALRALGPTALKTRTVALEALAGVALYLALLSAHAPVLGVDPLWAFR